jgi:hypothetical protein
MNFLIADTLDVMTSIFCPRIAGKRTNGWAFFLTIRPPASRSARFGYYVNAMAVDVEERRVG